VGEVRLLQIERERRLLSGPVRDQVAEAVGALADAGALSREAADSGQDGTVADGWERGPDVVAVLIELGRTRVARELLGAAARLASMVGGTVTAVAPEGVTEPALASGWGADQLVLLRGEGVAEDVADVLARWSGAAAPWAVLAPATMWGREVASRLAARLGAGLTGDAVDLAVEHGRLVAWKPAFGGQLVAAVTANSPIQMATVRPGMLTAPTPRRAVSGALPITVVPLAPKGRVRLLASGRDDDVDDLEVAGTVVGVGSGVDPDDYTRLRPLLEVLGAELAASRKVTDRGWQPRSRATTHRSDELLQREGVAPVDRVGLAGDPRGEWTGQIGNQPRHIIRLTPTSNDVLLQQLLFSLGARS
jgi:electron transfer flavoprotein alpha subunit